jgi:hypothetical protein
MATVTDSSSEISGVYNGVLRYHYDAGSDVLYLRLTRHADTEAYGEETDEGYILLRSVAGDAVVGMTIVSYWQRFGQGQALPRGEAFEAAVARAGGPCLAA